MKVIHDRMSDTPRTDEKRQAAKRLGWNEECVWEWAQQLEREHGQLSGSVEIWQKLADERKQQIAAQSERLIALERELARAGNGC